MRIIAKCIICGKDFYRISEAGKRTVNLGARPSHAKTCSRNCSTQHTSNLRKKTAIKFKETKKYQLWKKNYLERLKMERMNGTNK